MSPEATPASDQELSARLFLYVLEAVGDPGAAEALLSEAAGRAFHWSAPPGAAERHRAMLAALTAVSHRALARRPRHPLPAGLCPGGDQFDQDIERCLAELAGRERAALHLVLLEGLSYEECSAVLGTTPANVGALVYRARAALRSRLVGAPTEAPGSDSVPATDQRLSRVLRTDCRQAGAFLSAQIDGELGEKQRAVLDAHMTGCALCAEERARLEQASAAVLGHWRALVEGLVAAGWSHRARRAADRGSSPAIVAARARRLRAGAAAACLAILLAVGLTWLALGRRARRAVTSAEGDCRQRGKTIAARGPVALQFFDGSRAQMQPGSALSAERIEGLVRPRLGLLSGAVRFEVGPGGQDLVIETAAGRAAASSGAFRARLAARDLQGRRLEMRFTTVSSLAPGERLALAVDSESDRMVLAGLSGPDVPVAPGALYAVTAGEQPRPLAVPGRWVALPRSGEAPPARWGAALSGPAADGLVFLFGGRRRTGRRSCLNDLWAIDPALGGWISFGDRPALEPGPEAGRQLRPPPQQPGALAAGAGGESLWLYGGRTEKSDLAELWRCRADGPSWKQVKFTVPAPPPAAAGKGRKPPPKPASPVGRRGAALAFSAAAGGIVLVGGELGRRRRKDTWLFDIGKRAWRRLAAEGAHPEARSGAALAAAPGGRRLYLFGGRSASGAALNDTWVLDVEKGAWRLLSVKRRPSARAGATMAAAAGGRLVLFGGRPRLGGALGDTWVLSPAAGEWNRLVSRKSPPAEDFGAPAMVWQAECETLILWCQSSLWSLRLKK